MYSNICYDTLSSTSSALIRSWPFVKPGIFNFAPKLPSVLTILKPPSAIITLLFTTYFKNFEFSVISWSLALPPQPLEIKQMVSWAVIPIKYLPVL